MAVQERWQQVGEKLGLLFPEYIGRLVVPLFDRGAAEGPSIVETPRGLVVARLINGEGLNEAGFPNRKLVTAAAMSGNNRGWVAVETHVPRTLPESPWGVERCRITDYGKDSLWHRGAPRSGAGVGTEIARDGTPGEEQLRDSAVAALGPLVNGEGIDLFHPDNVGAAQSALQGDFAGHILEPAVRSAVHERLGVEAAEPKPVVWV